MDFVNSWAIEAQVRVCIYGAQETQGQWASKTWSSSCDFCVTVSLQDPRAQRSWCINTDLSLATVWGMCRGQ